MPQLLIELFSEEIPARMQGQAARDLERMASERLKAAGLTWDALTTYAGPRRLTLVVEGLPVATPDREEEVKGPRTSAPEQALEGFLRKTGLTRDQLSERDGVWFAVIASRGVQTTAVVPEMVDQIVRGFPWPKSMRWGSGTLRWVRPLKRIVALFDGAVVPFDVDGIHSGDVTEGHRFLGSGQPFAVKDFADYRAKLEREFVLLDAADRRLRVLEGAKAVCAERGLALVDDDGLLEEVAGLAEWPTPILGEMDPAFLDLPPEVIRLSMKVHQKYFAVVERTTAIGGYGSGRPHHGVSRLAPNFVVVANVEASDGGKALAAGNSRVLSARLNDARFFWDEDRKVGFDAWLKKLEGVTFHAKLGTMAERVERIAALAREIAPLVGADSDQAERAARLAKADLASAMVGEFPELQGVMGGYYARALTSPFPLEGGRVGDGGGGTAVPVSPEDSAAAAQDRVNASDRTQGASTPTQPSPLQGEGSDLADAIRDHYKPQGPNDTVPTAPLTVAVALADKLDTLVGFFAIDEKPTGSKDPFALRRAALGVIRLVLQSDQHTSLLKLVTSHHPRTYRQPSLHWRLLAKNETGAFYRPEWVDDSGPSVDEDGEEYWSFDDWVFDVDQDIYVEPETVHPDMAAQRCFDLNASGLYEAKNPPRRMLSATATAAEILTFFADRLKVLLRDQGQRHDLVDAVFALGDDDLVRIVRRVEALGAFLATEDGANLLAGYKRASNILKAEEKKGPIPTSMVDMNRLVLPQEQALAASVQRARMDVEQAVAAEDFAGAMRALAGLRAPVDAFFVGVMVNSDVAEERDNRLKLLGQVRDVMGQIADFGLIAG